MGHLLLSVPTWLLVRENIAARRGRAPGLASTTSLLTFVTARSCPTGASSTCAAACSSASSTGFPDRKEEPQVRSRCHGIRSKYIFGSTLMANEAGPLNHRDFLPEALAAGRYVTALLFVAGHGLQDLQQAVDLQLKRVSAAKGRRHPGRAGKRCAQRVSPVRSG
jgi:hypothetical protein